MKAVKINSSRLTIDSGATLNIRGNGVEDEGIEINSYSTLTNNGTINIESATQTPIAE